MAAPTYALPAALVGKPEVSALRTADSATFDLGDDHFARYQDTTALHYQDSNGAWRPIDPAFVQTPRGWVNATNLVRTAVDQQHSTATISAGGVARRASIFAGNRSGWQSSAPAATSAHWQRR